jgi:hypothetical protein
MSSGTPGGRGAHLARGWREGSSPRVWGHVAVQEPTSQGGGEKEADHGFDDTWQHRSPPRKGKR